MSPLRPLSEQNEVTRHLCCIRSCFDRTCTPGSEASSTGTCPVSSLRGGIALWTVKQLVTLIGASLTSNVTGCSAQASRKSFRSKSPASTTAEPVNSSLRIVTAPPSVVLPCCHSVTCVPHIAAYTLAFDVIYKEAVCMMGSFSGGIACFRVACGQS